MAKAFAAVRQSGRELTDEEVAELELGTIPSFTKNEQGVVELTQAELAILEGQGATIREVAWDDRGAFDRINPAAADAGDILFQYGKGQSQFTGRVKEVSDNSEKVWMWHPITAERRLQSRTQVVYLAQKGWLARPPEGITPRAMEYPCPSVWAQHRDPETRKPVKFATPHDAQTHFRVRHSQEYAQVKSEKETKRQDAMDRLLERLGEQQDQSTLTAAMLALNETLRGTNDEIGASIPEGAFAAPATPEPAGKRK